MPRRHGGWRKSAAGNEAAEEARRERRKESVGRQRHAALSSSRKPRREESRRGGEKRQADAARRAAEEQERARREAERRRLQLEAQMAEALKKKHDELPALELAKKQLKMKDDGHFEDTWVGEKALYNVREEDFGNEVEENTRHIRRTDGVVQPWRH